MVVDEAHRLKNKDSALANALKTLKVEHMHLLSGTPLQNSTTEVKHPNTPLFPKSGDPNSPTCQKN